MDDNNSFISLSSGITEVEDHQLDGRGYHSQVEHNCDGFYG
jgi:hypothetical protein